MSDLPRLFVSGPFTEKGTSVIEDDALHHISRVLRLKTGSSLLLLDGTGGCAEATLEQIDRNRATARVHTTWRETETAITLTILQALPKGDKLDLVLQKGTELGVTAFHPVVTDRSARPPSPERAANREVRWQRIIREAARQCRRSILPQLAAPAPLETALDRVSDPLRLVLWEEGAQPLEKTLPEEAPASISLLVGPEGGFGQEEMTLISSYGFQPVHLGPRIMRTETAGLAATPVLQYLYGDWRLSPSK